MIDFSSNRLLAALQAYRPGRILRMGDLRSVEAGIRLYERFAVEWTGWDGADRVKFDIGKDRVVISTNAKGAVVCECKRCGIDGCAHSVAVMATVAHAIRGKMGISSRWFPVDTFAHIRNALFEGPEEPGKVVAAGADDGKTRDNTESHRRAFPPVRVVQDGNGQLDAVCMVPRASLSLRGVAAFSSPTALRALPKEIRELFEVPMGVPHELEEVLFGWAAKNLDQFAMVVDAIDGGEAATIDTIVAEPLAGLLNLRRRPESDSVDIEFVVAPVTIDAETDDLAVATDRVVSHFHRLGKTLIYLPDARALGRVVASEAWEAQDAPDVDDYVRRKLFQRYRQANERQPFMLVVPTPRTIAEFNMQPVAMAGDSTSPLLVRYFDGDAREPTTPARQPVSLAIHARPQPRSGSVMLVVDVSARVDVSRAFDEVCDALESIDEVIAPTYSRNAPIFAEWRATAGRFLLARTKKERRAITRALLDSLASNKRTSRMHHRMESAFEELGELLSSASLDMVMATHPSPEEGVPPWIQIDPGPAALTALAACCSHFATLDFDVLDEPEGATAMTTLTVSMAEWKAGLPGFCAECARLGISLTIDEKKVETVALDFQVKAEPVVTEAVDGVEQKDSKDSVLFEPDSDRIDWFALHPKIFCDQVDVPEEQWAAIVQGGTFQTDGVEGVIRVVDAESLERFALFLRAGVGVGGGGGSDNGKRDPGESVRVPRLQILDWMHLKNKGIDVVLPDEDAAIIDSLMSGKPGDPAAMPDTVQATLRPYQIAGYRWMAFLYEHRFGAVLADDMGLGKTLQTITLLAGLDAGLVGGRPKHKHPHLAVLPPSLIFNWRSEIERFLPGLKIYDYTGGKRSLDELRKSDIALTSYELARRDIEKLEQEPFDIIIFDEAQAAKNILAARSKAIRRLKGRFRLCLTGTPLENHVGEYFSILDLALPGLIGGGEEFRKALRPASGGGDRYLRRAQPFVLRRTKENVLKDLPPKIESDIFLDLDRAQKEFYTRTVAEVRAEVAKAFEHKPKQQAGIVALSALMRLRQICVAPGVIDPSLKSSAAPKLDYLVEKLQVLREEGHAALVFSQFTRVLDLIEPQLASAKLAFLRLDGKTPQKSRKDRVEQFQSDDGPGVFLISLKAGGAGLNLTRASYVFHLDPWWNPAVERQASDRAHRIGQKNKVFIHRILMRDTIEEKMMVLKARKQELYDEIMGSAEAEGERIQSRKAPMITREDIGFLLG